MDKNKFKDILSKARIRFEGQLDDLRNGGKTVISVVLLAFVIMAASCLAVFFMAVQGAEKVLVPDVTGKSLTDALTELQAKELYPRIMLKYSELPGDKGTILEQNPVSGAIVKAYRRVNLTVSRGIPIDYIEDYSGKNVDEVLNTLELLFSSDDSLVQILTPVYKKSGLPAGTILAQYPEAGTPVSEKIKLQFVVSCGTETPSTEVPDIEGLSIRQLLPKLGEYKVIFDFEAVEDSASPAEGVVFSEEKYSGPVEVFSRVKAAVKVLPASEKSAAVQGVFSAELPEYPYPVPVRLDSQDQNGRLVTLAEFFHPGKHFTVPYNVKKNTTLILYVLDEEYAKVVVE